MLVGSMQLGIDPYYLLTDQQVIVHMLVSSVQSNLLLIAINDIPSRIVYNYELK